MSCFSYAKVSGNKQLHNMHQRLYVPVRQHVCLNATTWCLCERKNHKTMVAQHMPSFHSFRKPLRRYFDLDEIFKATPFLNRAMKTRGRLPMPRGALAFNVAIHFPSRE